MRLRTIWVTNGAAAICLGCLISLPADSAAASQIHYEWSGTIVPSGASDPWLIGASGLPFVLEMKVDRAAADMALAVDTALFAVDQARLVVAGQEIPYVGDGFLDFTDDSFHGFDLLTFNGVFELNGVQSEAPSVVTLPLGAVEFVVPLVTPPTFGSVGNVLKSATGNLLYSTVVESETLVLGVPEPPSICMVLLAFGAFLSRYVLVLHWPNS